MISFLQSWTYLTLLFLLTVVIPAHATDNSNSLVDKNNPATNSDPIAKKGVLDLSNWDFESAGTRSLSGDWEFHWQQLLTPDQLKADKSPKSYRHVPAQWLEYAEVSSSEGYATYRLVIHLPHQELVYGLFIKGEGSAYRFWINGDELASDGKVGVDKQAESPAKNPKVIYFNSAGGETEFVIQISNFNHHKGGFRNELVLGLATDIQERTNQSSSFQAAAISVLVIIAVYHFLFLAIAGKRHLPSISPSYA